MKGKPSPGRGYLQEHTPPRGSLANVEFFRTATPQEMLLRGRAPHRDSCHVPIS